jgi:polysaccharide export outer membrane protein
MNFKSIIMGFLMSLCFSSGLFGQIQPGSAVQITISGVPAEEKGRFDPVYPVAQNGTVNMPFIGQVRAAGLRAEQLASTLESLYKAKGIYKNPTFQVIDSTVGGKPTEQVVVIGGQVRAPGPKPWNRTLTLWQAIQAAGGPTEFGSMKRVKLIRGKSFKTYDCTKLQFQQIPLEPDDAIEVPQVTIWNN